MSPAPQSDLLDSMGPTRQTNRMHPSTYESGATRTTPRHQASNGMHRRQRLFFHLCCTPWTKLLYVCFNMIFLSVEGKTWTSLGQQIPPLFNSTSPLGKAIRHVRMSRTMRPPQNRLKSVRIFMGVTSEDLNQLRTTDTTSFPLYLPPGKGNPSRPHVTVDSTPSKST